MPQGPTDRQEPISEILREFGARESLSVGEIVDRFGHRAFGALMFVFAIPNLLPLPPGSSTLLGAPLLLLSPQVALGIATLWLPKAVDDRRIAGADLAKVFDRLLPSVERIEKVSRPRLTFLFGPVGDRVIGVICSLLSFVLILPIPLGNLLPALTIGVLGFALFQRDGLFALVGYGLAAVSGAVLFVAADLVIDGVRHLVNWFGAA
ncbi:exopolysaccharide biosynthesis protein [Phenylobacterium sp.]|uniref:exopolysaccharide biosynthesis protein n=1 Tax=Phenylobacterium sp. TaxID=1871053 RepID=UPI00286A72B4|nr:exopolysaccharide biosynthesis protein [Phenylobacterium sp.]